MTPLPCSSGQAVNFRVLPRNTSLALGGAASITRAAYRACAQLTTCRHRPRPAREAIGSGQVGDQRGGFAEAKDGVPFQRGRERPEPYAAPKNPGRGGPRPAGCADDVNKEAGHA